MKLNSKFGQILTRYNLLEAVNADDPNQAALQDKALDPNAEDVQPQQAPVKKPEKPEMETLTPEGEVELIRMIRQALMLNIDTNTIPIDLVNVEINQENGRETLEKLRAFMSTFTTS